MNILGVARGALRPLHIPILAKQMIFGKKQKTRLVSPQPAFYMTGYRVFNPLTSFANEDCLLVAYDAEVQLKLLIILFVFLQNVNYIF